MTRIAAIGTIITTGGTGITSRDGTYDAVNRLLVEFAGTLAR